MAPPTILHGDSILISALSFNTTTAIADTVFANYYLMLVFIGAMKSGCKTYKFIY